MCTKVDQKIQLKGSVGPWRLQLPFEAEEEGTNFHVYQVFDCFNHLIAEIKPTVKIGWVPASMAQVNVRAMASAGQMMKLLLDIKEHSDVTDEPLSLDIKERITNLLTHINFHAS